MSVASFNRELRIFTDRTMPGEVVELTKKIAFEAGRRVIFRTPVDTGHARANWQLNINQDFDSTIEVTDKSGAATLSRLVSEGNKIPPFAIVWIGNNVIYIAPLERGHSKQAPDGMVDPTVSELEAAFN